MSSTSFLAFAMLVVLITLSWSQPGKAAAATSADANPERAAGIGLKNVLSRDRGTKCAKEAQSCKSIKCCKKLLCVDWRNPYTKAVCVKTSEKSKAVNVWGMGPSP